MDSSRLSTGADALSVTPVAPVMIAAESDLHLALSESHLKAPMLPPKLEQVSSNTTSSPSEDSTFGEV